VAGTVDTWKMVKAAMSVNSQPPVNYPVPPAQASVFQRGKIEGQADGSEQIKTDAGLFECKRYKITDGPATYCFSEKVTPIGLVRQTLGDKLVTVLTAAGNGASSRMPPAAKKPPEPMKK
jgi:hypothetical protein